MAEVEEGLQVLVLVWNSGIGLGAPCVALRCVRCVVFSVPSPCLKFLVRGVLLGGDLDNYALRDPLPLFDLETF